MFGQTGCAALFQRNTDSTGGTHGRHQKRTRSRQGFASRLFTQFRRMLNSAACASLRSILFRKPSGARPRKGDARSNPRIDLDRSRRRVARDCFKRAVLRAVSRRRRLGEPSSRRRLALGRRTLGPGGIGDCPGRARWSSTSLVDGSDRNYRLCRRQPSAMSADIPSRRFQART